MLLACETRRAVTYHLMTVAELKTLIQASRLRATRPSPASVTRVLGGGTCSANPFNNAYVALHSALQEYQRRLILRALVRLHSTRNGVELD